MPPAHLVRVHISTFAVRLRTCARSRASEIQGARGRLTNMYECARTDCDFVAQPVPFYSATHESIRREPHYLTGTTAVPLILRLAAQRLGPFSVRSATCRVCSSLTPTLVRRVTGGEPGAGGPADGLERVTRPHERTPASTARQRHWRPYCHSHSQTTDCGPRPDRNIAV